MEEVRDGSIVQQQPKPKAMKSRLVKPSFRKVQVVYYLSKNGQLEQPHFIEVTHLVHHQLRLKDVMDRLAILRGRGMPSLYSWSCKRSYKNGYVWNDLTENDVIFPSEGAEYVLKGSEVIEGCTEKLQQLQVGHSQESVPESTKRQLRTPKRHIEHAEEVYNNTYEEEEEEISYTNTPSRCSRGVSTDEIELLQQTKSTLDNNSFSPPSTTTSSESNTTSKRFEDGDPIELIPSRNSLFFHLIASGCGSVGFKGKSTSEQPRWTVARKSSSLHKGVLCKAAKAVAEDEISCMSENPRFGNLQSEEKEYFSGSIVESMSEERAEMMEPKLKKSTSYDEKRSSKAAMVEEMKSEKATTTGKCIPRKKSTSKPTKK